MRLSRNPRTVLAAGWCCLFSAISVLATPGNCLADDHLPYVPLATQLDDDPMAESSTLDTTAACGTCCEPCCCTPCCPCQVWVNAIFLVRNSSGGEYFDPAKGQNQKTWDNSEIAWGPSVGVTFCPDVCNPYLRVGVEFYAVDGWSTTRQIDGNISVQFPSLPYLPDAGTPGVPSSRYGLATFHYRSNLYNTEFNVYRQSAGLCWLTTLAGFRWIEFGEGYSAVFETGNTAPNYAIDVNNHLYGFQVGAQANLRNRGPWRVDSWMKAGVYGNAADQDTMEDFTSAGGQLISASARSANVAFVGDMGISVSRQVTDCLNLRFSYMGLWLEGIALAPEQLDNSDPSSALATLDASHGAFFHGGFIGAEFLW